MALPLHLASVHDAIAIAVDIARNLGLAVHEAVPLRSTNNAVAWLRPVDVVAKVSASSDSLLQLELDVAKELTALGAPVGSLAEGLPEVVHRRAGLDVTFWKYHDQPATEPSPASVARALNELHASLAKLSPALKAQLPSYMEELRSVRGLLADRTALPALSDGDRELLITTFDRLKAQLDQVPADKCVVIHGSPHSYNVLVANGEPIFIDFETTCFGPREWDCAHLDAEVQYAHPELLSLCRSMLTVKTAVLCTAEIDRGDMREHAEYHLALVRENFGASSPEPVNPGI